MTTGAPYPLILLAGALAVQVYGWFSGRRLFDSANGEAIFFVIATGYLAFMGWFSHKVDGSDTDVASYSARTLWVCCVVLGVGLGLTFRLMVP